MSYTLNLQINLNMYFIFKSNLNSKYTHFKCYLATLTVVDMLERKKTEMVLSTHMNVFISWF